MDEEGKLVALRQHNKVLFVPNLCKIIIQVNEKTVGYIAVMLDLKVSSTFWKGLCLTFFGLGEGEQLIFKLCKLGGFTNSVEDYLNWSGGSFYLFTTHH